MRASKADKFYMGMLLAIICFCFGLLRIMDEADARRAAERETLNVAEPPAIVGPAFQPVQTVYFEPDPEPEDPAAEVFVFRENVPLSAELQEVLWDACQEHKVEYALALGLIETESSFNPEAVSCVGCYGLMQLNPDYFEAMVYTNLLYREKAKLQTDEALKTQYFDKAEEFRTKAMDLRERLKAQGSGFGAK